ncbi:MAG: FecR domain-containing protein, partial [Brevinematia bacterium]
MEDKEKIIKESLNFSKLEKVNKNMVLIKEEVYMRKTPKLLLGVSLILVLLTAGILIFYEEILTTAFKLLGSKVEEPKEEVITIEEPKAINAVVSMVVGDVKVQNVMKIEDIETGYTLKQGDTIITSDDSECEVQVNKVAVIRIGENTKVSFSEIVTATQDKKENIIDLAKGSIKSAVRELGKNELKVKTGTAIAAVRGTKFAVSVDDEGNTKVLVSEGKVAVSVRSKTVQDLLTKISDELKSQELSKFEAVGEVIVEKGEEVTVSKEKQKRVDEKIKEELKIDEVGKTKKEITADEMEKAVKLASKEAKIKETKAEKKDIALLDKVSEEIVITSTKTVKVRFVPDKNIKDAKLFINGVEIAQLPIERILEVGKEYNIEVKSQGKTIFSKELKFSKNTEITIRKQKEDKPIEIVELQKPEKEPKPTKEQEVVTTTKPEVVEPKTTQAEPAQEKGVIGTIDSGAKIVVGYGKWVSYTKDYIFATPSGVGIFDGKTINEVKIKGISYAFSDNIIVAISKDESDHLVVKVANTEGRILSTINLGESTKGTLVVSRPAIVGRKVFVPSIDGVYVIDYRTGEKTTAKIGCVYSDVAPMN